MFTNVGILMLFQVWSDQNFDFYYTMIFTLPWVCLKEIGPTLFRKNIFCSLESNFEINRSTFNVSIFLFRLILDYLLFGLDFISSLIWITCSLGLMFYLVNLVFWLILKLGKYRQKMSLFCWKSQLTSATKTSTAVHWFLIILIL